MCQCCHFAKKWKISGIINEYNDLGETFKILLQTLPQQRAMDASAHQDVTFLYIFNLIQAPKSQKKQITT